MYALLLLSCAKTGALTPLAQSVSVRAEAVAGDADENGRSCSWEEESLWVGDHQLFGTTVPDDGSCGGGDDHWQLVEITAQNGRYASVRRTWGGCCPEVGQGEWLTWDLERQKPASVLDYDAKWGEKRVERAQKLVERGEFPGLADPAVINPERFVIHGEHVAFVVVDALGREVLVPVR